MKKTLVLVAALAATLGTAAAQGSKGIGISGHGSSGNNNVSAGNSAGTSSSASNSNSVTSAPNYKPGAGTKTSSKAAPNQVTRSGGQGHNSTPQPKGKVVLAPTAPASNKSSTGSTNTKMGSH